MKTLFTIAMILYSSTALSAALRCEGIFRSSVIEAPSFKVSKDFAINEYHIDIRITQGQAHSNAIQNFAHINRMAGQVEGHAKELNSVGVNVEALVLGIYFSDMGKSDRASHSIIQRHQGKKGWDQNTRMKAFLRHEDYGIELVKRNYKKWGMNKDQVQVVVDTIVNHNGPGILESWWGSRYFEEFNTMYELPKSLEGVVHSFLDRVDQGSLYAVRKGERLELIGGVRKIVYDETSRSPHKKFSEVVYDIFYNTPRYSEQQVVVLEKYASQIPTWKPFFKTEFFHQHFALIKDVSKFREMIEFNPADNGAVRVRGKLATNPQELFEALESFLNP